jgi:hypothetical protein
MMAVSEILERPTITVPAPIERATSPTIFSLYEEN